MDLLGQIELVEIQADPLPTYLSNELLNCNFSDNDIDLNIEMMRSYFYSIKIKN